MSYILYSSYMATFSPRDDETFVLKESAKAHIGKRLRVMYSGVIDDDRPSFAGEHEFTLDPQEPSAPGLPVWFSERDLIDIVKVEQ